MEKFMKLKEYKNKYEHYFVDGKGMLQGEFKLYHSNGQLEIHCFYKDDKIHGEYKRYYKDGSIDYKRYYSNGKDVTDMYNKLKKWKSL